MACTCHCSSSQETSGHYFTPVSSFTMDDSKEPDSLEYKNGEIGKSQELKVLLKNIYFRKPFTLILEKSELSRS